jgi:hypothetical protein
MNVAETANGGLHGMAPTWPQYESSPFAAAMLSTDAPAAAGVPAEYAGMSVSTPFSEALASLDEADLEREAVDALRAEFEDEGFREALEALANEVAGQHLAGAGNWSHEADGLQRAATEAELWMETVARQADQLLAELEAHFGDRSVDTLTAGEIEAAAGWPHEAPGGGPLDAQEQFFKGLLDKVKKVANGVGKVIGRGVRAVGALLPLGKLFGILRRLVRPLLHRVLQRAIGKLPPELQSAARTLAGRLGLGPSASRADTGTPAATPATPATDPAAASGAGPAGAGGGDDTDSAAAGESRWSAEALADEFDTRLAEAVLTPHDAAASALAADYEYEVAGAGAPGEGPYAALDAGRQRLAQQLLEAEPGQPPVAELEQFIPVVMGAMKLIKLGVRVVGRKRVVDFLAKMLATLIQGMVGQQAARGLARHIADAGLRLLGLEAEHATDGTLGAEALVATVEDTVREVLSLPAESMDNELLLEAATQEAFTAAAVRHFPPAVLRPDLAQPWDGEHGIWLMFPRSARPHYRYKKYSVVTPVRLTQPLARVVVFANGETLEDRLLDAGARSWPVSAEVHHYELLPGAEFGHLAAFEADGAAPAQAATEFDEVTADHARVVARPADRDHRPGAQPVPGAARRPHDPQPGVRVVRVVVPGLRLHPWRPFTVRLDLSGARPVLRLHLHLSERLAHELAEHLARQRMAQVVAEIRRRTGEPMRQALSHRLHRILVRHGITPPEGASAQLAGWLAEAIVRTVAAQLPTAATELASAAKDPADGVTLTFAFPFASKAALTAGHGEKPHLRIRSGVHRD